MLKDKEIIALIIGDIPVEDDLFHQFRIPYMRGQDICEFYTKLGFNQDYSSDEKKSRTNYMKDLIDYVIKNNIINNFLKNYLS